MSNPDINLFRDEEFEEVRLTPEKVVCLGMEFESDDARRAYFREELRKKLPELRQIEGFPIGEDEDIINLSEPPYYTACPNPWLNDFVAEWEKEKVELERQGKRCAEFEVNEPYASDVSEGKNNPIYMAHAYHTKVPHPAIMRYILHYTQPGDIVFDGFAGTGMTGVATGFCQKGFEDIKYNLGIRHSIIGDLSPIASFISYNFNHKVEIEKNVRIAHKIISETKEELNHLYKCNISHGGRVIESEISYVIWSQIFSCPNCGKEISYYSLAVEDFAIKKEFKCPHCASIVTKSSLEKCFITDVNALGQLVTVPKYEPALIKYNCKEKKGFVIPSDEDILKEKGALQYLNSWIPNKKIEGGVKTKELINSGYNYVADLYTKRNLVIFSKLWEKFQEYPLLRFILTGVLVKTGSKLHNVGFKNNTINLAGALPNALFVPSIFAERNVFELFEGKLNDIIRMSPSELSNNISQIHSATCLSTLNSNAIDYIFTDPPFGANLMYSELNIIHEAWLNLFTDNRTEAIENSSQGKSTTDYSKLMVDSFKEFYRVLKPGRWMTVEFSNTSAAVWNAIQVAITTAGFNIAIVRGLDKQQGSFNSQTTTTAVKQDLVITCYKPTSELINKFEQSTDKAVNAMDFIEELLYHLPVHFEKNNSTTAVIERSPKILYDRLISYYVQHGYAIPMDAQEFQKALRERFIERDGMFFTASQTVEYEAKKEKTNGVVPMALFISSEAEGIEWLKRELAEPQTYQEILPNWMKDMVAPKKGDVLPELAIILEENFIKDEDSKWRKPDAEKAADLEILRGKKLMKEFNLYLEQASKPKTKRMKDTRLEVLRYGFKECYKQKNYQAIVTVGDHIQESLLQEDEVLLQYYDIASMRV